MSPYTVILTDFGEPDWDLESQVLPEANRAFVGAHDKVELHGKVATAFRMVQRVKAHGLGNTLSGRPWRRHVSAVSNVRAASSVIGTHVVRAHHLPRGLCDEGLVRWRAPVA